MSAADVPPDDLSWPSDQQAATMTVQDWLLFYSLRRSREHDVTLLALQATATAIQPLYTASAASTRSQSASNPYPRILL